ncbi:MULTISPECIES: alpha/beta hydrolase [unclassified Diaminobutyricimonas]|uniref:alpha/beta hydrolase n=1 Tax=unclassified Diaminobutyricimonas TaxID=2643261 RepID=UPI0012F5140E|nr:MULTISPECIES: alpha/beta hydrolase [unclassified Diaminobutyricimonas]
MHTLYETPAGKRFTSQEELDQQYDIEATVPREQLMALGAQFASDSAQARDELGAVLDIPYGPTLAERLDVFPGEPGGPVVVFIHGGYWRLNSRKGFSFMARGLVGRGATMVIPSYALCPTVSLDEIVRQQRAAVAWTYRHAAEFGADPERLIVSGHSAGGHATAVLLDTDWEGVYGLPENTIRGGCAISGLFDIRPLRNTFLQPSLQLTGDQVIKYSPILDLPTSAPPLLVTLGGLQTEEFDRQSKDFFDAWRAAGLTGDYYKQPDRNHFDELFSFVSPDSELIDRIMDLSVN